MSAQSAWLVVAVGCTIAGLLILLCAYLSTVRPWMDDPAADIEAPELEHEDGA